MRLRSIAKRIGIDRVDAILVLTFVMVVGPWVNEATAQPISRYLLTAAVVEQGTVALDDYAPAVGVDRIEVNGRLFSDKAPLQPLLGVPVLALAEAVGIPEATSLYQAESIEDWANGNLGVWTQTFTFAVLPAAALLPLTRRHARRFTDDSVAVVCAVAMVSSSMVLLFSTYLYGHVLAALLAFAAWHVVSSTRLPVGWRTMLAGSLVAAGVAVEYPVIGAAAVLALWVWRTHGFWRSVVFSIPTAVACSGILAWNYLVYGTFTTSYAQKGGTPTSIGAPKLYNTYEIFFGRKGFVFTPIVLLALAGLMVGLWQRRAALVVPAAVFTFVFLLQASWPNPWGGETSNPRYMLLALPFLVYPLAIARPWISPLFFRTLAGVGALSMGLAVTTLEIIPDGASLISAHIRYIGAGEVNTTLYSLAFGHAGWIAYTAVAGSFLIFSVLSLREHCARQSPKHSCEEAVAV